MSFLKGFKPGLLKRAGTYFLRGSVLRIYGLKSESEINVPYNNILFKNFEWSPDVHIASNAVLWKVNRTN